MINRAEAQHQGVPAKGLKQIIRGRILLVLLVGALFLVILFSISQFLINIRAFRESKFELTRSLQHSIMWQIKDADETIRFIRETCNKNNEQCKSALISAYRIHSYFTSLMLLDRKGEVRYAEPETPFTNNYSALMKDGFNSPGLFSEISTPYVEPKSGTVTVDFKQQTDRGNYVVGQLDVLFLQGIITKALEGGDGSRKLIITDSYGNVLAHPDFSKVQQQVNIGGSRLIKELQDGPLEGSGFYKILGSSYFLVSIRIPEINWFLIDATRLDSLIFELGKTFTLILGLFFFFILVWSFFVGNLVNRKIVVPLHQFIATLYRSTEEEYPVPVQHQISEYTEFIELQYAFNSMSKKIREKEGELKKFQEAVQQAGFAIYITDKEGYIEYVNPAFERTTGYTPEEAIGRRTSILNSGQMEQGYYENLWSTILNGRIWEEEIFNTRKDGSTYYGYQTIAPIVNDEGEIVNFVALQSDISERKRAAQKLQESEALYKSLFQLAADAIMLIEPLSGKVVEFNERAYHNLGYTAEEFRGVHLQSIEANETPEETKQHIKEIMETGYGSFETLHKTKNGEKRNVIVTVSVITYQNNVHLLSITHDITKLKKIETQLRKAKEDAEAANQAKSDFIANVSHEIRTPMNAVLGYNQLLSSLIEAPQARSYLSAIEKSGTVLLELINDILDLSKIEAGRLSLEYGETNLRRILQDIEQIFSLEVERKGLELHKEVDEEVPEIVLLDEARIRQILLNLLGNAVKFTDAGMVGVRVKSGSYSEDDEEVDLHIHVFDSGVGIEDTQLERIFEAFRQQEGQSTRKYGGTGLGLSITKRLVEAMNGKIDVQSTANEGSTFSVHFFNVRVVQKRSSPPSDLEGAKAELSSPAGVPLELDAAVLLGGIKNPDEFVTQIEEEFYPRWKKVRPAMFIDDVQGFAEDLYAYALSSSAEYIAQYARNILEASEKFQIDRIEGLMDKFEDLVTKLKS